MRSVTIKPNMFDAQDNAPYGVCTSASGRVVLPCYLPEKLIPRECHQHFGLAFYGEFHSGHLKRAGVVLQARFIDRP